MPRPRSRPIAGIATDTTLPSRNTAPEPSTDAARIHLLAPDFVPFALLATAETYGRTRRTAFHRRERRERRVFLGEQPTRCATRTASLVKAQKTGRAVGGVGASRRTLRSLRSLR